MLALKKCANEASAYSMAAFYPLRLELIPLENHHRQLHQAVYLFLGWIVIARRPCIFVTRRLDFSNL